jgi:DNA polymerase II large subunit
MYTSKIMMLIDLTKQRVDLKLYHISIDKDQYFNSAIVRKNLKKIYKKVIVFKAKLPNHAPTVISDAKTAEPYIPKEVRKELSKAAKQ